MGTFDVNYCPNGEADLRSIYPGIAEADRKRSIDGWTIESTHLYKSGGTGSIDQLFRDELELGTAESSVGACTSDGKWHYASDTNTVYLYSNAHPKTYDIEAGTDWADLVEDSTLRASRTFEAITGRYPIKHRWATLDYDGIVKDCVAALTVGRLLRPYNKDLADQLEQKYNYDGDEFPKGYMQQIRDKQISLSEDINPQLGEGILVESSIDGDTTGGIDDIRGRAIDSDTVEIKITTGGTFSYGTASPVYYQVKGKSSTGFMTSTYISASRINGDYQSLAHGLELRFAPGAYKTNDAWYVSVSAEPIDTHQAIRNIRLTVN